MKNIFEGAKFGDKFRTRDRRMAIYQRKATIGHFVVTEESVYNYNVYDSGRCHHGIEFTDDIISKWEEPINEEELDRLAWKEYPDDDDDDTPINGIDNYELREAFKAGYRKAKEE